MLDCCFREDLWSGHEPINMLSVADWLDYQDFWAEVIGEAIYNIH